MSELYREQRPLLNDDLSNDEYMTQNTSLQFHKRMRNLANSGRAKVKAKGAISVLTRWPDHLSSLLTYWWAGFGMIAVTIFIIYNSMSIIEKVSPMSALPVMSNENVIKTVIQTDSSLLNVFMHIFVKEHSDISTDIYLPYIKVLSKKHSNFQYNVFFVVNDVKDTFKKKITDENNNKMAWNSLWSDKIENKENSIDNISIQFISLTNYLDKSPLRKYWREVPEQFIEFLVKCVAIWEKGGIAFNPILLTPESPDSIYSEKLHTILKKYAKHYSNKQKYNEYKKKYKPKTIPKAKVNNIRDIINNLENQDEDKNISPYHLEEAENREVKDFKKVLNSSISKRSVKVPHIETKIQNEEKERQKKYNKKLNEVNITGINNNNSKKSEKYDPKSNSDHIENEVSGDTNNILPKFLKYLFNNKFDKPQNELNSHKLQINETHNTSNLKTDSTIKQKEVDLNVFTVKKPSNITTIDMPIEYFDYYTRPTTTFDEYAELTIDLKGNVIAAKTPCHAFIGTVFSNIARHSEKETITNLILAELSLFCKGSLSSCHGVDVILL